MTIKSYPSICSINILLLTIFQVYGSKPDNQTLIVSYFNTHSYDVNIFFMIDDEIIFKERGLSNIALSKRYSLRQLQAGNYTIKLNSGGYIYSYPLVLN